MGEDAQRQCTAVMGLAKEKHGDAQEYNELQRQGEARTSVAKEGHSKAPGRYAQLRRSNECKAGEGQSKASLSSGNELRSNEQKSKKEWIA